MVSLVVADGLRKSYGEKVLLDGVVFTVEPRERIGLIGVNGTGKSTLLKVLAGVESTEEGSITHANDFTLTYLRQEPVFSEDRTVLEEVFAGEAQLMRTLLQYEEAQYKLEADPANERLLEQYTRVQQQMDAQQAWDAGTQAKTILTRLGVSDFHKRTSTLSGGQKKRVALAKALIQPADLLLLDEPTNHLDHETIEWLEKHLATYTGSLIMVTHDRYFLNRVTNRIFELDQGQLYTYKGNYELFLEKKAERVAEAQQQEQKLQNTLRRELAWLRRGAKARTTKQKARIGRVESLQEQSTEQVQENLEFAIGSKRLGNDVIEAKGITKAFDGRTVVPQLDYLITKGERLGITGPNGSGKTTLLNMLAGRIEPDAGEVLVGQTVRIGYYTQEHEEMDESLRVIEYITEVAEIVHTVDGQIITAEQMLERFLFPRSHQWTYIHRLSGGERRRLYLLRVLMSEPNVLFLDEPTNDLDTETLSVLEDYLDQFPGVVLTVSHDRYFLDRTVDHLLAFESGEIHRFQGHYTDYLEQRRQQLANAQAQETVQTKTDSRPEKRKKKLSYNEQKEWDGLEDRIEKLEEAIKTLEAEIQAAGSDAGKATELFRKQQEAETELEQAMERWEELSELIESFES